MYQLIKQRIKSVQWILATAGISMCVSCSAQQKAELAKTDSQKGSTEKTEHQSKAAILFDDFNYQDLNAFYQNGWKARTQTGHPGVKGASWSEEGISFLQASEGALNGMARITSYTDGTAENTLHTQICHARKYREGTFAARVYFRNKPTHGPDGDEVIQTFYVISPLKAPMDLDYSELDFEYLPNGGWGKGEHALWATSWETFQLEPWTKVNENDTHFEDLKGWHTLVLQVGDNKVRYYVDGKMFAEHSDVIYPEERMSINFNQWFTPEGPIDSKEKRVYQEDIDWVYHNADEILSPLEVDRKVAELRKNKVNFRDTVSPGTPVLPSPCGL
ncbi:glycoside hydrolase family 16 protein [Aliikangiella coralliicola]|uniref:Glycoside hydrolase family 16 protein n=1 Tax=Aliikangiella coralliicola TaxID=2592383 RepID=A0A545UCD0_9GAMM|nr:glycoside hydrolase family 16 protein [Aliikangiella coralliicola]TQV87131.1 glycoside hydrolase family 16 protein [Aliikangiella coralliicola]